LWDAFYSCHMGITAENICSEYHLSREELDQVALESQQRAVRAVEGGVFRDEIVPVEVPGKKGPTLFEKDQQPRADTTAEGLAKLKPFARSPGTITAGNASGLNDGACALVLASDDAVARWGLVPRARVLGMAAAGVPPRTMGVGPVPAIGHLLERLDLALDAFDVVEINEAFAAQVLACTRALGFADDDARVNANGGAIALGHPLGASGARLCLTAMHELHNSARERALIAMCVGVGQGVALALERVP